MQVGFIGTGSMGKILIEAFLESQALLPTQVHVSNRTFSKAKELAQDYTGLHAYPTNVRVAQKADIIFLCVKPLEFKKVIEEIEPFIRPHQIVVSITSPIEIKDLEQWLPAKIAKIIPSITNSVQSGASLMAVGRTCTDHDKDLLDDLMKQISQPIWIDEKYTRVSSDIVSCGPAFLSYLLQAFIDAAVRKTDIPKEQASTLTSCMVIGMGELLAKEKFSLESLQQRVCVPGGVTGAGLKVLEGEILDMFDNLFEVTHLKFAEDVQGVKDLFYERNDVNYNKQ